MNYGRALDVENIVLNALKEDIGNKDITTELFIPKEKRVKAALLAKDDFIVCGLGVVSLAFKLQDKNIKFRSSVPEGTFVKKGEIIARIQGKAQSILTAERVALNFLSHLSGISTKTRKFVDAIRPYRTRIMDTRKTTPGLRILEKYAVRIGGGCNHRMSLDEIILVKDNHLKIIDGYLGVRGLAKISKRCQIELEVKSLDELRQALRLGPDIIMLDNMNIKEIKQAIQIRNNFQPLGTNTRVKLEVSGGVNIGNIRKIAATGVDMISVGSLTHSVASVDISLEII